MRTACPLCYLYHGNCGSVLLNSAPCSGLRTALHYTAVLLTSCVNHSAACCCGPLRSLPHAPVCDSVLLLHRARCPGLRARSAHVLVTALHCAFVALICAHSAPHACVCDSVLLDRAHSLPLPLPLPRPTSETCTCWSSSQT